MYIPKYTRTLPDARDKSRRRAAERGSYWNRFRRFFCDGFFDTKGGGPAVIIFPVLLELERGTVVWVGNDEAVCLVCVSGVLWITEGDQRDLVLKSGESLTVHKDQRALVHALVGARFTMRRHTDSPA